MPSDGSGGGRKLRMDRYSVGVCVVLVFSLSFDDKHYVDSREYASAIDEAEQR
jgi:hypothetical protein